MPSSHSHISHEHRYIQFIIGLTVISLVHDYRILVFLKKEFKEIKWNMNSDYSKFVPVRTPPPPPAADSCSLITFEQRFGLPDAMLVDCRRDLDPEFSKSNMEFAISQPKRVRLPRNEKQIYWLKFRPQMWPSGLTLAMTFTFEFWGQLWPWPLTTHMALTMDSCYFRMGGPTDIEQRRWK